MKFFLSGKTGLPHAKQVSTPNKGALWPPYLTVLWKRLRISLLSDIGLSLPEVVWPGPASWEFHFFLLYSCWKLSLGLPSVLWCRCSAACILLKIMGYLQGTDCPCLKEITPILEREKGNVCLSYSVISSRTLHRGLKACLCLLPRCLY